MWVFNILYFIPILYVILMLHDILLKTWESGGWGSQGWRTRCRHERGALGGTQSG